MASFLVRLVVYWQMHIAKAATVSVHWRPTSVNQSRSAQCTRVYHTTAWEWLATIAYVDPVYCRCRPSTDHSLRRRLVTFVGILGYIFRAHEDIYFYCISRICNIDGYCRSLIRSHWFRIDQCHFRWQWIALISGTQRVQFIRLSHVGRKILLGVSRVPFQGAGQALGTPYLLYS